MQHSIPASYVQRVVAPPLPAARRRTLRALAGTMIPASSPYQVPGADDEAIFADIEASLGRDREAVLQALEALDRMAGQPFDLLAPAERLRVGLQLRDEQPSLAAVLAAVTVRCYYRDDRVMRAIGMQPRPPHPGGFEVEQGDWSLLEPVRARGRIWRDAS